MEVITEQYSFNSAAISVHHEVELYGDLQPDLSKYTLLFSKLRSALDTDLITIHLTSPGGSVLVADRIRGILQSSPAHSIVYVHEEAGSAAATIALSGRDLVITPGSYLFFHDFSYGVENEHNRLLKTVEVTHDCENYKVHEQYTPFLTKKEIAGLQEGKEVYIKWDDPTLLSRTKKHFLKRYK